MWASISSVSLYEAAHSKAESNCWRSTIYSDIRRFECGPASVEQNTHDKGHSLIGRTCSTFVPRSIIPKAMHPKRGMSRMRMLLHFTIFYQYALRTSLFPAELL